MKRAIIHLLAFLTGVLLLTACAPKAKEQSPQQPAAAVASPTASAVQALDAPVRPSATERAALTAAPTIAHASLPGGVPAGRGIFLGDQSTVSSFNSLRAFTGDRFTLGRFERPYNAETMDVYFPYVDIVSADFYPDSDWAYLRIALVGPDSNNAFPGNYAVEIDSDMDGRGDVLILANYPSSTVWSTDRVRVLEDRNGDVGGETIINADTAGRGDGFEYTVFDQGQGEDPDLAWARVSMTEPNSVEIAYKTSLLQGDKAYLAGIWAGNESLDPGMFDLNDHFSHDQAGAANPDIANFYPIKQLAELDNTCRQAIGFIPSGHEPGLCPQGQ